MNAVAQVSRATPAKSFGQVGVAKALAQVQTQLLAPVEESPWCASSLREFLRLAPDGPPRVIGHRDWCRAKQAILLAPTDEALETYSARLEEALSGGANVGQTRLLVGMLIDSFPAGRPASLAVYADSILHDLATLGFSPTVVALGCQSVRRSARFLPTVAEVIEACERATTELKRKASTHEFVRRKLSAARAIAILPEPEVGVMA